MKRIGAALALLLVFGCGIRVESTDSPGPSPAPTEPRYDEGTRKAGTPCTDPGTRARTTTGRVLVCVPPTGDGRALWTEEGP